MPSPKFSVRDLISPGRITSPANASPLASRTSPKAKGAKMSPLVASRVSPLAARRSPLMRKGPSTITKSSFNFQRFPTQPKSRPGAENNANLGNRPSFRLNLEGLSPTHEAAEQQQQQYASIKPKHKF